MKKIKTIKKPRLSINSFAEFNHATSNRKESIVKEHKYPKDGGGFGKYRSRLVDNEIHEYICTQDSKLLKKAKKAIKNRTISQEWHKSDNENSLAMLEAIANFDLKKFKKYDLKVNDGTPNQTIKIEGLTVSIYPRILIFDKSGTLKGGIITRLTKKHLSKKVREDVALMLQEYLENQTKYTASIDRKLCLSFHVRESTLTESPSAFKNRKLNLLSAARTIVALWTAL